MKINFQATNIGLTDEIKNYIADKLRVIDKLLVPAAGEELFGEVEVGKISHHHKHGAVYRAEINLHWAGRYFRSEATASDLYAAIDDTKDELVRELKTWRKKQGTLIRRGGRLVKNFLRGIYKK